MSFPLASEISTDKDRSEELVAAEKEEDIEDEKAKEGGEQKDKEEGKEREEKKAIKIEDKTEYFQSADQEFSLTEVLEGTSGVRVQTMCTNCNIANVTMCGQTGERVQVWKDGLPVMGGLGAIYLFSVMPPQGIANTEIIRGAGTVLSGSEAGTGAVFIKTRAPEKKPYFFVSVDGGSLSWQSQKLLAAGQLGRFGGELVFTRAESDGSDPNGDGNFDLASFERTTIGGTVTFKIFDRSHLRFDALRYREDQRDGKGGNKSFVPDSLGSFYREDIDIQRDEFGFGWDLEFPDNSLLTVRARSANREQDTSDDSTKEQPYMFVEETAESAEARYERTFVDRHIFNVGFNYKNFEVHGTTVDNPPTFPDGQDILDLIRQKGAYAQIEFALPKRIDLSLGLRYDDFQLESQEQSLLLGIIPLDPRIEDRSELLPRIRLAWKPINALSVILTAGESFSPPRPFFERVCCGATITLNPDIKPEESRDYLLDIDFIPRPWFKLRASVFTSDIENYIQKIPWFTASYIPSFTQVNYNDVELEGVELSNEWRFFDRLNFGFDWSHVEAEADDPALFLFDLPLFDLPPGQIPYLPEDQGSAFIRWDDQQRGLNFSAQAQYTGSMMIQMQENFFGLVDTFVETPSFWVYNFRTQVRIYKWLSIFAGVDNITDEFQLWLDDPRYEYNWGLLRGRYYYAGLSWEM
jgi:outer membrane receptor protein involved in Fe transport